MGQRILALIEPTIGIQLLLSARLRALGYDVILSPTPRAFSELAEAESFDWILLDADAVPVQFQPFARRVARCRKAAHIAWLGDSAPRSPLAIDAVFRKPLQYDQIDRFFFRESCQVGEPRSRS